MRVPRWFRRRGEAELVDRAVAGYRSASTSGLRSLADYWDALGPEQDSSILAALVKADLRRRFEGGERPQVLEYLHAFPMLAESDERVVSLVYEEFCFLQERGDDPDSRVFCERYEPWRDSLMSQLAYHRELSRAVGCETASVKFPDPGDRFAKYRLESLLGVGGVAQVYLAIEEELGGRQVAIKVSESFGQEPSILGKLDHRNIVPILTVAESEAGLRGICMPYRPGATLEALIKRIGRGTPPRHARVVRDLLRPIGPPGEVAEEGQPVGWADFPIDRTFPEAVAWIGHALAEALAYLHKQGVYHRDIKPANILLAHREGPQLLDFNLAQVPNSPEGATAAQKGGTLPYMAPEQLKAFLDPAAWDDVGVAADVYSLGLVLRQLLTGRPPELPSPLESLPRQIQSLIDRRLIPPEPIGDINPGVPPALDSIVGKCLAFRPAERYASAEQLAVDLKLFLERKALRFAPNSSPLELGVNWAYRNRHAVLGTILFALLLAGLSGLLRGPESGEASLALAEHHLESGDKQDWETARVEFERLRRDRPDTARSSLGLALTLAKLGVVDENVLNPLHKEAMDKDDAETVFKNWIGRDPGSAVLHLNLGLVLIKKKQYGPARESLERALALDPGGLTAMIALAELDLKEASHARALDRLDQILGRVVGDPGKLGLVYSLRQHVLDNLVHLIDARLESGGSNEDRAAVEVLRRRMEAEIVSFGEVWELNEKSLPIRHAYFRQYYEGCLASIRGVLEADRDDQGRSETWFELARSHFDQARAMALRLDGTRERLKLLGIQEQKLLTREGARKLSRAGALR